MDILSILGRPKEQRTIKADVMNFIMVLFTSTFTIIYTEAIPSLDGAGFGVAGIVYSLRYVPIMITTALGGNVPGMASVLLVFLHRSFTSSSFSYLTFIYLLVVCVVDLLTRRRFFNKWYKVIFVTFFMMNLVGTFWAILLLLLSDNGIMYATPMQIVYIFLNELPGCLLSSTVVYLVFKKLPDKVKLIFANGKYYVNPEKLSDDERYEVEKRSRISSVIMNIIVFEALVLGLAAEFASNTLIPTMHDYYHDENVITSSDYDLSGINSAERLENTVYRQLTEEVKNEGAYFADTIVGGGINYRYSVRLAMLISILVIPLAVFVNRYAQYRIARPIRNMSKVMSGIYNAKEGYLNESIKAVHDLDLRTGDEIEDLYHAVDLTVYRLVEYIELVKTRQSIEDQLQVAKSANEAKSRFLSNISHEIRTPINAVLGFDEMILRESKDDEILGYARDIQSSGKTLLALINDILDFSKIEAGKMEIIPVEYELGSMMNDIVNMSEMRAREKSLKLHVNVDENTPHILFGDEIRIKQCIINIITNAVKYTEEGSVTLDVSYEVVESEESFDADEDFIDLKVSVSDTGIGIRQEDMDKLLGAFERIDVKKNRTIEGTGLGISIVTSLLGMMDSKLEVDSEYGKGSVFSFVIRQKVISWDRVGDFAQKVKEAQKDAKGYKESFQAEKARILVVDDTKTNLTVIEGLLKQTKMKIDTATSGKEALKLVKENKYDVIFLDHRMPEMDGVQTFHAMEEMEDNLNKETPVIALTANAISGSREMYFREGFTNYMSKPVDPAKLEEMILSYLPEDMVSRPGDVAYVAETQEDNGEEKAIMQELLKINGIDINSAIERCGSAMAARDVMRDFWLAIDDRAAHIERYEMEKNIKDYTIYVHGLKSSAKAIGALDLSEKAEYLEACGNGGDIDEIEMLTPGLLTLYRSYSKKLEVLFAEDDNGKPLISPEDLEGAFASIKEFVSASYFDSADDIVAMLEGYRIPADYKNKFLEVKRLLAAVDRDGLLNVL
ncbi:response regulator [Butyrivibrio sp. CB08]|uniref:response regulator n=1 Tax=Butyrivibrio sp. CB08 TaxID=2364879 RepID=UPI000EA8627E|nr:response regulator [Butyrivibrio sp. CB08]RKM61234.1 response regulator [Butyrivibrio sp. CB08]